jgi:hypothetical protein
MMNKKALVAFLFASAVLVPYAKAQISEEPKKNEVGLQSSPHREHAAQRGVYRRLVDQVLILYAPPVLTFLAARAC